MSEWISFGEWPNEVGDYLCLTDSGKMRVYRFDPRFNTHTDCYDVVWTNSHGEPVEGKVTHWRELPEGPVR